LDVEGVNQRTDDNVNKRNDPEALFFSVECVTMADNNNVGGEIIALTYAYDTHHTQQRYWRLGEFLPFRLDDAISEEALNVALAGVGGT
jgi:hypothetical protein